MATQTEIERLIVKVVGDVSQYTKPLEDALKSTTNFVSSVTAAFEKLASAVMAASTNAFATFQERLANIEGLVGIAAVKVAEFGEQILKMAPGLGKGPQELADALYFITSAGLKGAKAMDALEFSAKAAAAGLGSTQAVADAVTSAMNAYAKQNMTAVQVTDIMVAAVREGKMEAHSLAAVMGRLLPLTSALGVDFAEISGALAAMSRIGSTAADSASSMNSLFLGLRKPTKDGAEALQSVGLSYQMLRDIIRRPGGTIEAMRLVDKAFGDNEEAIAKVFPNMRAIRGVLNLLSQDAGTINEVMVGVRNSAGDTEKALAAMTKTISFQFKQMWASMQVVLIGIGQMLAPVVERVNQVIGMGIVWWQGLGAEVQRMAVYTGLVVAALLFLRPLLLLPFTGLAAGAAAALGLAGAIGMAAVQLLSLTGGVRLVLSGLLLWFSPLFVTVRTLASIVGLGVHFIKTSGGIEDAWRKVEEAAVAAWEWLEPVRKALGDLAVALINGVLGALDAIGVAAASTMDYIKTNFQVDWETIRRHIVGAIKVAEFVVHNFGRIVVAVFGFVVGVIRNVMGALNLGGEGPRFDWVGLLGKSLSILGGLVRDFFRGFVAGGLIVYSVMNNLIKFVSSFFGSWSSGARQATGETITFSQSLRNLGSTLAITAGVAAAALITYKLLYYPFLILKVVVLALAAALSIIGVGAWYVWKAAAILANVTVLIISGSIFLLTKLYVFLSLVVVQSAINLIGFVAAVLVANVALGIWYGAIALVSLAITGLIALEAFLAAHLTVVNLAAIGQTIALTTLAVAIKLCALATAIWTAFLANLDLALIVDIAFVVLLTASIGTLIVMTMSLTTFIISLIALLFALAAVIVVVKIVTTLWTSIVASLSAALAAGTIGIIFWIATLLGIIFVAIPTSIVLMALAVVLVIVGIAFAGTTIQALLLKIAVIGVSLAVVALLAAFGALQIVAVVFSFISTTVGLIVTLFSSLLFAATGIVDIFYKLPAAAGPLTVIGEIFAEWLGILKEIYNAMTVDMDLAWELLAAGGALAVSQIKDVWRSLYPIITEGWTVVWTAVRQSINAVFNYLMVRIEIAIQRMYFMISEQEGKDWAEGAAEGFEFEIGLIGKVAAEKLNKIIAANPITPSVETENARKELDKVRGYIEFEKEYQEWADANDPVKSQLDEIKKKLEEAQKAQEKAWREAQNGATEATKKVEKFDAALVGSAEAATRWYQYMDLFRPGTVVSIGAGGAGSSPVAADIASGALNPFGRGGQPPVAPPGVTPPPVPAGITPPSLPTAPSSPAAPGTASPPPTPRPVEPTAAGRDPRIDTIISILISMSDKLTTIAYFSDTEFEEVTL